MFKELIDEIKRLVDKCDLIGMSLYGYNQAIDDVLELIESYKPKWVDRPDESSDWWFLKARKPNNSQRHIIPCLVRKDSNGILLIRPFDRRNLFMLEQLDEFYKDCEWQKAIAPEME